MHCQRRLIFEQLITFNPSATSLYSWSDLTQFVGTVLLHLFGAVLRRKCPSFTGTVSALYIPVPSPFSELEAFIAASSERYKLDIFHCVPPSSGPVETVAVKATVDGHIEKKAQGGEGMRQALSRYKDKFPHVEAILIGTRRTDPNGRTLLFLRLCARLTTA